MVNTIKPQWYEETLERLEEDWAEGKMEEQLFQLYLKDLKSELRDWYKEGAPDDYKCGSY